MEGSRYEIIDTIASGEFAVVHRARDRDLGREVAIKQIHQQYLADDKQLSRYWQEAQLLASLQHPNIVTIHDIVKPKGWLILELMRMSLQPVTQRDGIDLDYLRLVLAGCMSALQFLHSNGVIHGDIKPSNLLVDSQGRVKLGDFGLARRASDEGGSLLKGTTKYMAPELLSPQFGEVGPASDLYSLGFSAYELMCGKDFETLFPGLGSYGRDKQIAWMMWHAASDRTMPPIHRILEGVPEDLARVIERLVNKDPSQRYQSAKDVLWDLRPSPFLAIQHDSEQDADAKAAQAMAARKKRQMRYMAIFAVAISLMLCVAMLLPSTSKPATESFIIQGVVTRVYPEDYRIALKVAENKGGEERERLEEIKLTPRYDKVFINDEPEPLDQVQLHDFVRVEISHNASSRRITEIHAYRPKVSRGRIISVKADSRQLTLAVSDQRDKNKELTIGIPPDLKITFNGIGSSLTIADLKSGDRAIVRHVGKDAGREAAELSIERVVSTDGIIRDIQASKHELTLETDKKMLVFSLADPCEITINNLSSINERRLKPADLLPGDKATISHDAKIIRVVANRIIHDNGIVDTVLANALDVIRQGEKKPTRYNMSENCAINFGVDSARLRDIRAGDLVEIAHQSLDRRNPEAISVAVKRASDRKCWAILIGNQDYDDRSLSRLEYPVADATLLQDTLIARYRVPAEQLMLLTNETLSHLGKSVSERLGKIGADDKLLVFVAGHAYKDETGKVYLAPKDFDFKRMDKTGLPLQWLADEMEKCPAKDKLLLFDCSRASSGNDLTRQPSTAEMLHLLKTPPGRSPFRTVTAIASCKAGQRGVNSPEKRHGLFALLLSKGYSGDADKNSDNILEPTELFGYLQNSFDQLKVAQTPELFLPDNRPPRLSDEAKTAIRKLMDDLRKHQLSLSEAEEDFAVAAMAAGKEIEPRLLYGLLLLKNKQRDPAQKQFDTIKNQHPDLLLPLQGGIWIAFEKRAYQAGIDELVELVSKIPKPKKSDDSYSDAQRQVFYWAGQLREFITLTVEEGRRPSAGSLAIFDAAIDGHGVDAQRLYKDGRTKSQTIYADFERQITSASSESIAAKLRIESRQVIRYVEFPYNQAVQQILAMLDQ